MRAALPWSFLAALALAGCAAPPQQVGGTYRTMQGPPRVVSLSPSTTELIASNLDQRMIVGRTKADDYPPGVLTIPVVAEVKPDYEAIQKLKPTLVVYDADLYNEADVKRIESMGAQSFAFKAHTIEGFEKEVYQLSALLGNETNVNDFVTRIERARSDSLGDKIATPPKVAVALGGTYFAGTDSFVADVVKTAGGVPVGPPSDKFAPMNTEALVAAAPDVIILPTTKADAAKDAAALRAVPGLAATPAVKNGRIVALTRDVVLRRGSRLEQFIRDLHRALLQNAPK